MCVFSFSGFSKEFFLGGGEVVLYFAFLKQVVFLAFF